MVNFPSPRKLLQLELRGLQARAQRVGRAVVSDGDAVTCGSQTSLGKDARCALVSLEFCSYIGYVCSYLITEQIFIGNNFSLRSIIFCLPQETFGTWCQQDWTGHWFELMEQSSGCETLCLETTP